MGHYGWQGRETILYGTVMVDARHYAFAQIRRTCTTKNEPHRHSLLKGYEVPVCERGVVMVAQRWGSTFCH